MPEQDQAHKPGIFTVTALHTDTLDTYKFFIPYVEGLHTEIGFSAVVLGN